MKIRPLVAELSHADGQADMTKLIFALCNFANVPKKRKVNPFRSILVFVKVEVQLHSLTSALYRGFSKRSLVPAENRTGSRTSSP
jgi:hypothetical protein